MVMHDLWPALPKWFWFPAGVYEITASLLVAQHRSLGFGLMYVYMGGVLSSLVYIRDEQGHTHVSGKGKLGLAGMLVPMIATVASTALVCAMDNSVRWLAPVWGALGFAFGAWLYHSNKKSIFASS